jgi:hypothetical protein
MASSSVPVPAMASPDTESPAEANAATVPLVTLGSGPPVPSSEPPAPSSEPPLEDIIDVDGRDEAYVGARPHVIDAKWYRGRLVKMVRWPEVGKPNGPLHPRCVPYPPCLSYREKKELIRYCQGFDWEDGTRMHPDEFFTRYEWLWEDVHSPSSAECRRLVTNFHNMKQRLSSQVHAVSLEDWRIPGAAPTCPIKRKFFEE